MARKIRYDSIRAKVLAMSEQERQRLARLTVQEGARELGIALSTWGAARVKMGWRSKRGRPAWREEWLKGLSGQELEDFEELAQLTLAKRYGVTRATINEWARRLARLGKISRAKELQAEGMREFRERIRALRVQGHTYREIAETLDVTLCTIRYNADKAGLNSHKKGRPVSWL